jgi:cytochrome c peroxidase
LLLLLTGGGVGCALFADSAEDDARRATSAMLSEKAAMLIGTLPTSAPNPANEGTPAKTGPYFHDGSLADLSEVVRVMGYHQVGIQLGEDQIGDLVAFLGGLTGSVDAEYVAEPVLPPSGPTTPAPDPS